MNNRLDVIVNRCSCRAIISECQHGQYLIHQSGLPHNRKFTLHKSRQQTVPLGQAIQPGCLYILRAQKYNISPVFVDAVNVSNVTCNMLLYFKRTLTGEYIPNQTELF